MKAPFIQSFQPNRVYTIFDELAISNSQKNQKIFIVSVFMRITKREEAKHGFVILNTHCNRLFTCLEKRTGKGYNIGINGNGAE